MGTSVNQASPDTLNWRAAHATYRDDSVPVKRVLQEIWRAASSQPDADFRQMLIDPIVTRLRDIALSSQAAVIVAKNCTQAIAESKQSSLIADIASRAAIQASTTQNPALTYSERLFAEASNYLISRDLPGYTGKGTRNITVSASIQLKASLLKETTAAVRRVGVPLGKSAAAWKKHAAAVVEVLRGKSR